jgi:glucosamine--fructose-6-phosphate aminotransferase (isomerizing)
MKYSRSLSIVKKKGKISELENSHDVVMLRHEIESQPVNVSIGIAHTRWATHGEPSDVNSHPHPDNKNEVAIVHNGIIENHDSLRSLLVSEGYRFSSQTDSEVLSHLISKFLSNSDLENSVVKALGVVEGSYGLAVVSSKEEKIIVAKRGSPIVIGIGDGEMFVASDVSAILEYTRSVVYLNDGEIAVLSRDGYVVKTIFGEIVDKEIHEIKWTIDQIEKKGYKHFMLKEIFEQPLAIANTLRGRLKNGKVFLDVGLDTIDFNGLRRIVITACGTSWHSALIGKNYLEKFAKIPVEVDYASEFRYRNPLISSDDLVIVISQSGETADTLFALREAKNRGARTIGIVNVVGSTISREVDHCIYLQAGPEIGVASTKAFSTQVIDLLLLSLYIAQKRGLDYDTRILNDIMGLCDKIDMFLSESDRIRDIAQSFSSSKNMLYLGRGLNFPVALEGALKLKEISYIHAEGYPAAEMKHGPIALIDENMPVLFVCPKDYTFDKILSNMEEIRARGGKIIAVTNVDDPFVRKKSQDVIIIPFVSDELSPIMNVVPLQLLAYHVADQKGIDVDKPRNLAKSVTVE